MRMFITLHCVTPPPPYELPTCPCKKTWPLSWLRTPVILSLPPSPPPSSSSGCCPCSHHTALPCPPSSNAPWPSCLRACNAVSSSWKLMVHHTMNYSPIVRIFEQRMSGSTHDVPGPIPRKEETVASKPAEMLADTQPTFCIVRLCLWGGQKLQDSMAYVYPMQYLGYIYTKSYLLLIWNSNSTVCSVLYPATLTGRTFWETSRGMS